MENQKQRILWILYEAIGFFRRMQAGMQGLCHQLYNDHSDLQFVCPTQFYSVHLDNRNLICPLYYGLCINCFSVAAAAAPWRPISLFTPIKALVSVQQGHLNVFKVHLVQLKCLGCHNALPTRVKCLQCTFTSSTGRSCLCRIEFWPASRILWDLISLILSGEDIVRCTRHKVPGERLLPAIKPQRSSAKHRLPAAMLLWLLHHHYIQYFAATRCKAFSY